MAEREGKEAGGTSRAGCVRQTSAEEDSTSAPAAEAAAGLAQPDHSWSSSKPVGLKSQNRAGVGGGCKFLSSVTRSEPSSHTDALDISSHSWSPAHPTPTPG